MGQDDLKQLTKRVSSLKERVGNMRLPEFDRGNSGYNQATAKDRMYSNYLEKVAIPTFSGSILDYPKFKRDFKSLTEGDGHRDGVLLLHLQKVLQKHIQESLSMRQQWLRLGQSWTKV